MSTAFFDTAHPLTVTDEVRVMSVALHACCCIASAGMDFEEGMDSEAALLKAMKRLVSEVLELYPKGTSALWEITQLAKHRRLHLVPTLDPDLKVKVIQ